MVKENKEREPRDEGFGGGAEKECARRIEYEPVCGVALVAAKFRWAFQVVQ